MGQDDKKDALFKLKDGAAFEEWRTALFARALSKGLTAGLYNPPRL